MDRSQRKELAERLVLEGKDAVYHLAFRMLGNEADARDATQETFVRLLRNLDRFDTDRPVRPWLFRIAANVVSNMNRNEKTRRRHEEQVAARGVDRGPERDAVAEREIEERLSDEVLRLPAPERILVGLRFYSGLTTAEAARALDLPRTTAQSRLARALDRLRDGLSATGGEWSAPAVALALRNATPPATPPGLTASLLHLASSAAGTAVSTGAALTLGGLVMTKKLMLLGAAVGLLLLGTGVLVGLRLGPPRREEAPRETTAEVESLRAENARLLARLRAPRGAPADAPSSPPAAGVAPPTAPAPAPAEKAKAAGRVDWARFSTLYARLARKVKPGVGLGPDIDPDVRALAAETYAEYARQVEKAHQVSAHPFRDPAILEGLVDSLYSVPVGLAAGARERIRAVVAASLRQDPVDPERDSPTRVCAARLRVLDDVLGAVEAAVGDPADPKLVAAERLAAPFIAGSREVHRIGMKEPVGDRVGYVLSAWKKIYGLEDSQLEAARPAARRLVSEQSDVLGRAGSNGDTTAMTPAAKRKLDLELLRVQVSAEQNLLPLLSPEQQAAGRHHLPALIRLAPGTSGYSVNAANGGI